MTAIARRPDHPCSGGECYRPDPADGRCYHQDPERLKRARFAAAMTVKELAQKTGYTPGHIYRLKKGANYSTGPVLLALADALGCDIADLMPGRVPGDPLRCDQCGYLFTAQGHLARCAPEAP